MANKESIYQMVKDQLKTRGCPKCGYSRFTSVIRLSCWIDTATGEAKETGIGEPLIIRCDHPDCQHVVFED